MKNLHPIYGMILACLLAAGVGTHLAAGEAATLAVTLPQPPERSADWWREGGWGKEAAMLPSGATVIAGVGFTLDPRAVQVIADGASIELAIPDAGDHPRLYLLHAGVGAPAGTEHLGAIAAPGAEIPVVWGQDVGPWGSPTHLPRAAAGWKQPITREGGSPRNQATAYVGWYVAGFDLPAGTRTVRLSASPGAAWMLGGAAVAREPIALRRPDEWTAVADGAWLPLPAQLGPAAGSALDLSGLLDPPAGRHGGAVVRDGRLVFADGSRARFAGVNLTTLYPELLGVDDARLEELAERFARMGINLVRVSHLDSRIRRDLDGRPGLEPVQLDRFDRLVHACKRRGIYVTFELEMAFNPGIAITRARYGEDSREAYQAAVFVEPDFLADLQEWTRLLLTHVNPYTGSDYAHEAAVVFVGMNNEDCLTGLLGPKKQPRLPVALRDSIARAFARHLGQLYGGDAALRQAWGGDLAEAEGLAAGVAVDLARQGRRQEDTTAFLVELHLRAWQAMDRWVRSLGLTAPLTDVNFMHSPFTTLVRAELPLVDAHGYFDHRKGGRDGGFVLPMLFTQRSMIRPAAWWSRELPVRLASIRMAGQPFTVSEYDACYPNQHRAEAGLVLGGLAALQDWDGMMQFTYGSVPESIWEPGYHAKTFDLATDPIRLAGELQLRLLFLRGDLAPAPAVVEVGATRAEVLSGGLDRLVEADLLPFVARVGRRVGTASPPGTIVLPVAGDQPWSLPRAQASDAEGLAAWFAAVKPRLLAAGNPSDVAAGLMTPDGGGIVWDFAGQRVLVDTPRSRGAVVKGAGPVRLSGLDVDLDAGAASFSLHSLDAQPIARSRRLLAILATDARTTGFHAEDGGKVVYAWGTGPMLLRVGKARLALASERRLGCWALDQAGRRLDRVPVVTDGDRQIVELDQRSRACVFWELAEEDAAP